MLSRRARRTVEIWPGFVDALSGLLMVMIFVLMVFVLAQFFLGNALSGSEQTVNRLSAELAGLVDQLALEKKTTEGLRTDLSNLSAQLTDASAEREGLEHDVAALLALKAELESQLANANQRAESEKQVSLQAKAELALLTQQLEAVKSELSRVAAALDVSEKQTADQKVQIGDLGKKLNLALLGKVEELQRYRSEFFGKLRAILGDRPGIRIEGDRFIFQSELLFDTASSELGADGLRQVRALAGTLAEIARKIPPSIPWVLRVDGHTDKRPIASNRYPSNWELSTARAISVIRALIAAGIPADHLAAAGFGEFQPLDRKDSDAAYARNRRIEIRLDTK